MKDKGITLVSTVITVIVLLILAGITLNALLGDNGIIKKAEEAGDKYKNSDINGQEQLNAIDGLLGQFEITTGEIDIRPSTANWTNQDITVTVNWPSDITGLTKEISTNNGTTWKTYTTTETITQNTIVLARLKDSTGQTNTKTASLEISNIDKIGPIITEVDANTKTDTTITVKITEANDTGIGSIAGYQYNIIGTWGETESSPKTFTGLAKNTTYNIYVRAVDSLGNIGAQVGPYSVTTEIYDPQTIPYLPDETYSYLSGTDLNNGLVCTNGTSQYVWIEVPKSVTDSASTTAQIETALQNYTSTYRSIWTDTWYNGCGIASQEEYDTLKNKMLTSIKTHGGFWIGRYEAGTADNSIRTNAKPITTNIVSAQDNYTYNYITVSQAQELCNGNSTSNYSSSLLFGIQWDLTCRYLESKGIPQSAIKRDSRSIGNYQDTSFAIIRGKYSTDYGKTYKNVSGSYTKPISSDILLTTGASERNKTMNIYDLAGNQWEMTLEKTNDSKSPCVFRGGSCTISGSNYQLSCRNLSATSGSYGTNSFRQVLYK